MLEQRTGCGGDVIHVVELEMARYDSIHEFVNTVSKNFKPIHIAILNAGIHPIARSVSPEGLDKLIQVNAVSSAYLAIFGRLG